jgi:hypothetical protein
VWNFRYFRDRFAARQAWAGEGGVCLRLEAPMQLAKHLGAGPIIISAATSRKRSYENSLKQVFASGIKVVDYLWREHGTVIVASARTLDRRWKANNDLRGITGGSGQG